MVHSTLRLQDSVCKVVLPLTRCVPSAPVTDVPLHNGSHLLSPRPRVDSTRRGFVSELIRVSPFVRPEPRSSFLVGASVLIQARPMATSAPHPRWNPRTSRT